MTRMPPVPIRNCRLAVNTASTRMSVARMRRYSSPVNGNSMPAAIRTSTVYRLPPPGGRTKVRNSAIGVVGGVAGGEPSNP